MFNSDKFIIYVFLLVGMVYAENSVAVEERIVSISSDVFEESYQIGVDSTENDHFINSFYVDSYFKRELLNRKKVSIKEFIDNGVDFRSKRDVVFANIVGENFEKEQGGMIVIDTLYNALSGSRKRYELHLAKDKTGWRLYNAGHIISKIKVVANKIPLVGVIGAKDLIIN